MTATQIATRTRRSRSQRPVRLVPCSMTALRSSMAQPYQAGAVSQVRPRGESARRAASASLPPGEEPVDGRTGARDVRAEGAELLQLVGERRGRRGRSAGSAARSPWRKRFTEGRLPLGESIGTRRTPS